MQKGIAQVYLLIVLLILGVGGYFYFKSSNKPVIPQPNSTITPSIPPTKAADATTNPDSIGANWKIYTIPSINLSFQYPPNSEIITDFVNSTALKSDKEYWVAIPNSDSLYLDIFLYKSDKTPIDWWNTEGKNKFEKLANEIENAISPKPSINLTYSTDSTTFVGKQALEIIVSSDYETPHTPKQRYLSILQQSGYITMISYYNFYISTSKQILSTFKFIN